MIGFSVQEIEAVVQSVDWLWRVATVILVPLIAWIAVTIRDVDKRLSVVEEKVGENARDIVYNRDRFVQHVEWGQKRSEEIAATLSALHVACETLKESVALLNQHVGKRRTDREAGPR